MCVLFVLTYCDIIIYHDVHTPKLRSRSHQINETCLVLINETCLVQLPGSSLNELPPCLPFDCSSAPRPHRADAFSVNCAAAAADTNGKPTMAPGEKDIGKATTTLPPADDPAAPSSLCSVCP